MKFPDHPPEVGYGGSGRSLCRYVLISMLKSLQWGEEKLMNIHEERERKKLMKLHDERCVRH